MNWSNPPSSYGSCGECFKNYSVRRRAQCSTYDCTRREKNYFILYGYFSRESTRRRRRGRPRFAQHWKWSPVRATRTVFFVTSFIDNTTAARMAREKPTYQYYREQKITGDNPTHRALFDNILDKTCTYSYLYAHINPIWTLALPLAVIGGRKSSLFRSLGGKKSLFRPLDGKKKSLPLAIDGERSLFRSLDGKGSLSVASTKIEN